MQVEDADLGAFADLRTSGFEEQKRLAVSEEKNQVLDFRLCDLRSPNLFLAYNRLGKSRRCAEKLQKNEHLKKGRSRRWQAVDSVDI